MQHQNLGANVSPIFGRGRIQTPMKGNHATQISATARQFQDPGSTEAIPYRGQLIGVAAGNFLQLLKGILESLTKERSILPIEPGLNATLLGVGRAHSLTIHVSGKTDIAQFLGYLDGSFACILL